MAQVIILYLIFVLFGIIPSLIWLSFYLKKDPNPEPNRMILKVFIFGALVSIPTIIIEAVPYSFFPEFNAHPIIMDIIYVVIFGALVEELAKYWVFRRKALKNPEFDEPVDAVIYMIIAGLGFAAVENILILFTKVDIHSYLLWSELIVNTMLRFLSATLLHALAAGVTGYFIALSIFEIKKRKRIFLLGITLSTMLHSLYNLILMKIGGPFSFLTVLILLAITTIIFTTSLKKLKNLKSVCKIY